MDIDKDKTEEKTTPTITESETKIENEIIDGLPEKDITDNNLSAAPMGNISDTEPNNENKSNKKAIIGVAVIVALGLGIGGYFMLVSNNEAPLVKSPQQSTNEFADIDDDMLGLATENKVIDDIFDLGFTAPPQPEIKGSFEAIDSFDEFIANEDFAGNIDTAPKPIDDSVNIIDPMLLDALESPPVDLEANAIPVEEINTNIKPVNIEPPMDIPSSIDTSKTIISNDFEDTPEMSNIEQQPNNMEIIRPSTTASTAPDIKTNNIIDTVVAPTTSAEPPTQTTAIPNIVDDEPPAQGSLKGNDTDMRDSLKEMPAREALIRPLPKKYMIIESSHTKAKIRKASTKRADTALRQGNAGAALSILQKIEDKNPGNKSVIMKQAIAYQQMGNANFALNKYEEILSKNPNNLGALTNMLGLLREKKPQLALNKLKELQKIYPDNAGIVAQLAIAYGGLKHYDEALKNLNVAERLDSPNAYYSFNKAVFLDHLGYRADATEMYKQALEMYRGGITGVQPIPIKALRKRLHISY